jgi:hypothetical protein
MAQETPRVDRQLVVLGFLPNQLLMMSEMTYAKKKQKAKRAASGLACCLALKCAEAESVMKGKRESRKSELKVVAENSKLGPPIGGRHACCRSWSRSRSRNHHQTHLQFIPLAD